MKFKNYLILLFICLSFGTMAQTKMIWHKSHSGSMENFKLALENNTYGVEFSNFGIPPALDSIIFISDSVVVLTRGLRKDTLYKHLYPNSILFNKPDTFSSIISGIQNSRSPLSYLRIDGGTRLIRQPKIQSKMEVLKVDSVIFFADTMMVLKRGDWLRDTIKPKEDIYSFDGSIRNHFNHYAHNLTLSPDIKFIIYQEDNKSEKVIIPTTGNETKMPIELGKKKKVKKRKKREKGTFTITNIERQNPNNNSLLIYILLGIILIFSLILAWFTKQFSKIKTIE